MSSNTPENTSIRLLIADDGETNRMLLSKMLSHYGYEIDAVCDGIEALNALGKKHYDAVLLDIHMPNMDGITAARIIKSQSQSIASPFLIAVTADINVIHDEKFANGDFDHILSKPINFEKLLPLLDSLAN
jgi:two-component system, sensor histidine kinase